MSNPAFKKFLCWSSFFLVVPFWTPGCFPHVILDRSSALKVSVKDFLPLVILPIPDAPRHPDSGARLQATIHNILAAKGYAVIPPEEVDPVLQKLEWPSPSALLSDPTLMAQLKNNLMAKLLLSGTFLEYQRPESYVGTGTFQGWKGGPYEYVTLPTYHYGSFRTRLQLKLVDPDNGAVIWFSEGTATGSNRSADHLTQKLVQRLLKELPTLTPSP